MGLGGLWGFVDPPRIASFPQKIARDGLSLEFVVCSMSTCAGAGGWGGLGVRGQVEALRSVLSRICHAFAQDQWRETP